MLYYDRVDISGGIEVAKSNSGKKTWSLSKLVL